MIYKGVSFAGVDEEDVIYDEEHWHDACLICTLCHCKLSGTSFVVKDDSFLCSECYQKTDDKRCKRCMKGFEPGVKRLVFYNQARIKIILTSLKVPVFYNVLKYISDLDLNDV